MGDGDESERRRRDNRDSLLRNSSFSHSERALISERSSQLDGALSGIGAVEISSVMGKHLVFRGVEGQESGYGVLGRSSMRFRTSAAQELPG